MFQAIEQAPTTKSDQGGFEGDLDARILTAADRVGATLARVSEQAGGAFPSLVAERLAAHGKCLPDGGIDAASGSIFSPELHPVEFEWYFTHDCARELAALLRPQTGRLLLLGAPTVSVALAQKGIRATTVDRSPFLSERFDRGVGEFRRADLRRPLGFLRSHSTVFFDPPWHEDYCLRWLWQAGLAVRRGGCVAFALFGPTTRSTAGLERARLLDVAEAIGRTTVLEGALSYRTPRFEAEALAAAGHDLRGPWRRGDLVLIENAHGSLGAPPVPTERTWSTRREGDVVVKFDPRVRNAPGGEEWTRLPTLDTVSRSRTRRLPIAAWNSRNQIAPMVR